MVTLVVSLFIYWKEQGGALLLLVVLCVPAIHTNYQQELACYSFCLCAKSTLGLDAVDVASL
jgi:hypothetical protein